MNKTTVRILQGTLDKLKLLKQNSGSASYEDVIRVLAHTELCKSYVFTQDGYAPIGAVVIDDGNTLVVKDIQGDRVVFDDGTYTINGGGGTWGLHIAASSVEDFEGKRVSND